MLNKRIRIEREEELQPLILSICQGIIYQFLFLRPVTTQLVLRIYRMEDKLCINVSDKELFELELRVPYASKLEESIRNVDID